MFQEWNQKVEDVFFERDDLQGRLDPTISQLLGAGNL